MGGCRVEQLTLPGEGVVRETYSASLEVGAFMCAVACNRHCESLLLKMDPEMYPYTWEVYRLWPIFSPCISEAAPFLTIWHTWILNLLYIAWDMTWIHFCSARSPNPWSGKKTPRDNATCNRGIYYWLEPGPPALTKGVRTKRPRAPVLSGIYWVQLLVGASRLVTQLQGNFCWPSPSWAFSFPLIGSLFLARHMLIGWLQEAW